MIPGMRYIFYRRVLLVVVCRLLVRRQARASFYMDVWVRRAVDAFNVLQSEIVVDFGAKDWAT